MLHQKTCEIMAAGMIIINLLYLVWIGSLGIWVFKVLFNI